MTSPRREQPLGAGRGAPSFTRTSDRSVQIRPSRESDWEALKAVRLDALRTEPAAFGSTLAREQAFDEATWRSRSAAATMLLGLAPDQDRAVGLVGMRPAGQDLAAGDRADQADVVELIAMYVVPEWRGSGLADRLIRAVLDRARSAGAARVQLWVTGTNVVAARVYRRCGFAPDGRRQLLPRSSEVTEIGWTRTI